MKSQKLAIKHIKIDQLNPSLYNPRNWDSNSIANLKESIQKFGLIDPIIVNSAEDRKLTVIGGHFRLKIARDLGFTEVPVVFVNLPDLEREKELNLRLNSNTGDWDYELLKNFDVEMLLDVGFDDSDLSHIWDEQLSIDNDEFDIKKALSKVKKPKTKVGDIYQIGRHRLICNDSTDPEVIKKLMGTSKASMLYFDPPYNINLDYKNGLGTKGKYGGKVNDNKTRSDYKNFLINALKNGIKFSHSNLHVFTWCDENYIGLLQEIYQEIGVSHKRVCLWIKNNQNVVPQIAFNKVYEPCVYGVVGNPYLAKIHNLNEILNKEVGTGNQVPDDILDIFSIWLAKRKAGQDYLHPTEKPVDLHEKSLRRCTKVGDIVLDSFGGSGSTLIACEQLNRTAYLAELSPVFCDVIINRYQQFTGKEAVLCK